MLSILNLPLDGNQASPATLSKQVILHRHTLSKKETKKKRIIGELQWGGQKKLVRPAANDSSVARLSKMTASSSEIKQELWRNRYNNSFTALRFNEEKYSIWKKMFHASLAKKKKKNLIMEAKGSWAYVSIYLLIVWMVCLCRTNPLCLQGREPN